MITLKHDTVVDFAFIKLTGDLITDEDRTYLEFSNPQEGPPEDINIHLDEYGHFPQPGCVFIKDWSEHEGLTASLVALGVVEIVGERRVGPFDSLAYEVRLLTPEPATV